MKSSRKKKRSRRMSRELRALLVGFCGVFFLLVCFSGWKVFSILHGYKTAERRYESLAGSVAAVAPQPAAQPAAAPDPAPSGSAEDEPPEQSAPPREISPVSVDFDTLRSYGGTVVGWLCLPQTVINYPVAQAQDNAYYLDRFLDGSRISGGTLFADCVCPSDLSGLNTIIYGHNMKDGSMFALLDDYVSQSFYDQHPVMYLNTPTQNYRVDIFSCFTTEPVSFVYQAAFSSTEEYASHLRALSDCSEIRCQATAAPGDRIVTLSTCTYSGADLRFVVCGKLTEIG